MVTGVFFICNMQSSILYFSHSICHTTSHRYFRTMGRIHSDTQFKTNKKSLPKLESSFFIIL